MSAEDTLLVVRWLGVAVFVGVLLLVTGTGVVAAPPPKPLPLRARVLESGEFAGFTPESSVLYKTVREWIAANPRLSVAQAKAVVASLAHAGFRGLVREPLEDRRGDKNGLSSVVQFASAASARVELAAEVRNAKAQGQAQELFSVGAIPGAVGFGESHLKAGSENIVFADGPFVYVVGNFWAGSSHNPERAALIGAATRLYERVRGHPAN